MKNILLLAAGLLAMHLQAQNISFTGTGLNSVNVVNLMTDQTLIVQSGDVMNIGPNVGINQTELMPSDFFVYPNPTNNSANVMLQVAKEGQALISVHDITGKQLAEFNASLNAAERHEFRINGLKNGIYLVSARGNGFNISKRLISTSTEFETPSISYVGKHSWQIASKKQSNTVRYMTYTAGDVLKYTAISGNNKTVMTDIPTVNKTVNFEFVECKDGDGTYYPVIKLGEQIWMGENMRTSKFLNGEQIPTSDTLNESLSWQIDPVYQWASNGEDANIETRGRVYTWFAAMDSRGICPLGWHLPAAAEFDALSTFLGTDPGNQLKDKGETWWAAGNTGLNTSGFSARATGNRNPNGTFEFYPTRVNFLTSTPQDGSTSNIVIKRLDSLQKTLVNINTSKKGGQAIRCIKDTGLGK